MPEHAPTLVVNLRDLANADVSDPTRVVAAAPGTSGPGRGFEQMGLWDLTGTEVRIRAQGATSSGVRLFRPLTDTSWPSEPQDVNDPAAWRDLRFVPDMNTLVGDGRIDPSLVGSYDSPSTQLPRSVAGRVYLNGGQLEGGLPSQESFRDNLFEFRAEGGEATVRQALTDTVRWLLESEADAVVIEITPVAGGATKRLLFAPSAVPHRLFISNLPKENRSATHHAMNDAEMSALHFGVYYALLLNEPALKPAPQLWRSRARKGTGSLRTVYCPGALFTRE